MVVIFKQSLEAENEVSRHRADRIRPGFGTGHSDLLAIQATRTGVARRLQSAYRRSRHGSSPYHFYLYLGVS